MPDSVCLVSTELAPLYGGGIGTYVLNMARAWAAAGARVDVITAPHDGLSKLAATLPDSITLHAVDRSAGLPARVAGASSALSHSAAAAALLRGLHAQRPFQYVEFPDYWGEGCVTLQHRLWRDELKDATIAVRLHSPTREVRRYNDELARTSEMLLVEHAEEQALRLADAIISPSTRLLELVRERLDPRGSGGLPPGFVVPYPFDRAALRDLGLDPDAPPGTVPAPCHDAPPIILYTGRLERRKGVDTLARAFAILRESGVDARLVMVGGDTPTAPSGGSMRAHVESLLASHADRLEILPSQPRSALGAMLRRAAVCCFPSRWENFPNACLEAMAAGAAVVGSSHGGMAEIIRDGIDGLLATPDDPEVLAAVLRRALADEPLRRRLASAAPSRIAEFCDPARVVDATRRALSQARAARGAATARAGCATPAARTQDVHAVLLPGSVGREASAAALASMRLPSPAEPRTLGECLDALAIAPLALVVAPGAAPAPEFLASALAAMVRTPSLGLVTCWSSRGPEADDPVVPHQGLDRDWVAAADPCAAGVALVNPGHVARARAWVDRHALSDATASMRLLAAALAATDAPGLVIPEPLCVRRTPPDALVESRDTALLSRVADLPLHADRPGQLLAAAAADVAEASARAASLVAHARRVDRWARDLAAALDTARRDLDTARRDLDTARRDLDTARRDLDTARRDLDGAREHMRHETRRAAAWEEQFIAARAHAQDLDARLALTVGELEKSRAYVAELTARLALTAGELEKSRAYAAELDARLRQSVADAAESAAQSAARAAELTAQLERARTAQASLEGLLARATAEADRLRVELASPRYRLADRLSRLARTLGLRGPLRVLLAPLLSGVPDKAPPPPPAAPHATQRQ